MNETPKWADLYGIDPDFAPTPLTEAELTYISEHLHSPEMQCKQCNLTRRLLEER